jgi:cell wall-associated NlpC family hydrolase
VQGEVTQLRAQEQHEQRVLAAQARARLAAAQAAAEREAAARAQAAKDRAAEAKAAAAAAPAPATTAAEAPPTTTTVPPVTTAPDPTTTAPAPAPAPPAASSAGAGHPEAAAIALRYLGIKYTWGGSTPAGGFDCSGLVMYVYAQLGISLPHYAAAQFGMGTPVARSDLQPGDLVFFDNLNHVGIYIGGGQMVHAPQTGDVVKITPLSQFGAGYVGARRI